MIRTKLMVLFLFLVVGLGSCKKQVIEIYPVIEVTKLNIETESDVTGFDFLDANTVIAAAGEELYKSTNGGDSWASVLSIPSPYGSGKVDFHDNLRGIASTRAANGAFRYYMTVDGGDTWSTIGSGNVMGFAPDGRLINGNYSYGTFSLTESTNNGQTWLTFLQNGGSGTGGTFTHALFEGDYVYFINEDTPFDREVERVHLTFGLEDVLSLPNSGTFYPINDVYLSPKGHYWAGDVCTNLIPLSSNGFIVDLRHSYDYHAVDGFGDLVVFVGEKSIASNMDILNDEYVNEVWDSGLSGFDETFYEVRFVSDSTLYISGSNGTFWRAKI
jgi:hypothetical protein